MPATCAVIGCNSRGNTLERKFYRFPMINKSSSKMMSFSKARQDAWLAAINRTDFYEKHYKHARVCDLHFVSGKSASVSDYRNPDWVPTLRLGYLNLKSETSSHDPLEILEPSLELEASDSSFNQSSSEHTCPQTEYFTVTTYTQTDDKITGMSTDILISLQERITFLEDILSTNIKKEDS
ncbi:hypothetical protein Bhyg_06116 [Pseudolycoriella hygida]|uniref:THAP-type domain-containing protein n=1 Tax=Pseudolycoriella hygida TaxID=35572 RepID=A0A9Q0N1K3_9DIPT|nr:hypothetical protein Bhyg_06116 [Pseudolycoriella hygida]